MEHPIPNNRDQSFEELVATSFPLMYVNNALGGAMGVVIEDHDGLPVLTQALDHLRPFCCRLVSADGTKTHGNMFDMLPRSKRSLEAQEALDESGLDPDSLVLQVRKCEEGSLWEDVTQAQRDRMLLILESVASTANYPAPEHRATLRIAYKNSAWIAEVYSKLGRIAATHGVKFNGVAAFTEATENITTDRIAQACTMPYMEGIATYGIQVTPMADLTAGYHVDINACGFFFSIPEVSELSVIEVLQDSTKILADANHVPSELVEELLHTVGYAVKEKVLDVVGGDDALAKLLQSPKTRFLMSMRNP